MLTCCNDGDTYVADDDDADADISNADADADADHFFCNIYSCFRIINTHEPCIQHQVAVYPQHL